MINKQRKVIYIHIPKCAGVSISKYFKLSICGRGIHSTLEKHREKLPDFNNYFKFTFVRNPWARLVSWFFYHRKFSIYNFCYGNSFKDWVKCGCKTHWKAGYNHSGLSWDGKDPLSYTSWGVYDNQYDFIGKLENLEEDLKCVKNKTSYKTEKYLKKLNTSNHKPYTEYYDKCSREIVRETYGLDIDFFDYKFGD